MSRIVAIDFGLKRIGLAISDESKQMAFPHKTLKSGKTGKETLGMLLQEIEAMEKERGCQIETLLFGLPLHLSGKESEMSKEVRYFSGRLAEMTDRKVVLWDERFTSSQATHLLKEGGMKRKERGEFVDALSASLLLENYLRGVSHQ